MPTLGQLQLGTLSCGMDEYWHPNLSGLYFTFSAQRGGVKAALCSELCVRLFCLDHDIHHCFPRQAKFECFSYCPTGSTHRVVQSQVAPTNNYLMINVHEHLRSDTQKNEHVQGNMRNEFHEVSIDLFQFFLFSLFSFIAAGMRYQSTHHWLSHGTAVLRCPF